MTLTLNRKIKNCLTETVLSGVPMKQARRHLGEPMMDSGVLVGFQHNRPASASTTTMMVVKKRITLRSDDEYYWTIEEDK
jgi:hypothetical protein